MSAEISETLGPLLGMGAKRFFVIGTVTVVMVASSGCGFRDREPTVTTTPDRTTLPPNDFQALAEIYDDELAPFGLRLTRGALIDLSEDSYRVSDTGTHLALYVEPTRRYPARMYLENLVPVAAVFAPDVFERWSALESFDVCQEPPARVDPDEQPEPDTQVNVTRQQSDALDWESIDASDLIAAALRDPPEAGLIISERIRDLPAYDRLLEEVERATGMRPTT